MNPVVVFDGVESNYINADRLSRTVRLVPDEGKSFSTYGDVLNSLVKLGVEPDEVKALYKVSAFDTSFSLMLAYSDTVERLISCKTIQTDRNRFTIMKMTEQVVTLRIHWLPIYFDNSILKEILGQYGDVLDVRMLKSAHADVVAFDGVREVRIKVDEFQKQLIPHLVKFQSGQSILVTMYGRPPYCLKCSNIGHTRKNCPGKSFANAAVNMDTALPASMPAGPSQAAADEARIEVSAELSSPADPPPQPSNGDVGASDTSRPGTDTQDMEQNTNDSLKRHLDSQDSFIQPNRPVKQPNLRPAIGQTIETANSFDPIMTVEDIMVSGDPNDS